MTLVMPRSANHISYGQSIASMLLAGLLILGVSLSLGCRPTPTATVRMIAGRTMGTTYSVKYLPGESQFGDAEIAERVQAELDEVNQQMSTYIDSSELSRFNATDSTDWFEVSKDTAAVTEQALSLSDVTDGAFDVTVGPLVNLWGFGPGKPPQKMLSQQLIDETREICGYRLLQTRLEPPALKKEIPQLSVDLSAIAKGHGVDRIARVLQELGLKSYFVEIGGEVRTAGVKGSGEPWQVGVEQPVAEERRIQAILGLSNQSLASSGDYRNFYELDGKRFSHTIDPRNGWPVSHDLAAASVVAPSCAEADAVATSMMVLGGEQGMQLAEQEGWAVMLTERTEEGFVISRSSAFDQLFPGLEIETTNLQITNAE